MSSRQRPPASDLEPREKATEPGTLRPDDPRLKAAVGRAPSGAVTDASDAPVEPGELTSPGVATGVSPQHVIETQVVRPRGGTKPRGGSVAAAPAIVDPTEPLARATRAADDGRGAVLRGDELFALASAVAGLRRTVLGLSVYSLLLTAAVAFLALRPAAPARVVELPPPPTPAPAPAIAEAPARALAEPGVESPPPPAHSGFDEPPRPSEPPRARPAAPAARPTRRAKEEPPAAAAPAPPAEPAPAEADALIAGLRRDLARFRASPDTERRLFDDLLARVRQAAEELPLEGRRSIQSVADQAEITGRAEPLGEAIARLAKARR